MHGFPIGEEKALPSKRIRNGRFVMIKTSADPIAFISLTGKPTSSVQGRLSAS